MQLANICHLSAKRKIDKHLELLILCFVKHSQNTTKYSPTFTISYGVLMSPLYPLKGNFGFREILPYNVHIVHLSGFDVGRVKPANELLGTGR